MPGAVGGSLLGGARQLFHHALGIGLRRLGAHCRLAGGLALLHDRLFVLLGFGHPQGIVEQAAFARVLQRFIGAADLGEPGRRRRIVLIVVGMG